MSVYTRLYKSALLLRLIHKLLSRFIEGFRTPEVKMNPYRDSERVGNIGNHEPGDTALETYIRI